MSCEIISDTPDQKIKFFWTLPYIYLFFSPLAPINNFLALDLREVVVVV